MSTSTPNNPFYCGAGTTNGLGQFSLGSRLDYIQAALKEELDSYGGSKKKTKICGSLSKFLGGVHDIDEMRDNVKMSAEALGLTDKSGNGNDGCTLRSCLKQRQITNQLLPLTNQQLYFFQYGAIPPEIPLFPGFSEEEARRERKRMKQAKKLEARKAKKVADKIHKKSSKKSAGVDTAAGATTESLPATCSTGRTSTVTLKDRQDKISVPPRKWGFPVGTGRAGVSRANRGGGGGGRGRGRPRKRLQPGRRRMEIEPVPKDVGPVVAEEIVGGGGVTEIGVRLAEVENTKQLDPPEAAGTGNVEVPEERMTALRTLDESIAHLKQTLNWD